MRKQLPIITEGSFDLVKADDSDVFSYVRTLGDKKLLVICSFADEKVPYQLPFDIADAELISSNYHGEVNKLADKLILRPYEALAYYFDK